MNLIGTRAGGVGDVLARTGVAAACLFRKTQKEKKNERVSRRKKGNALFPFTLR
jgi:hypothetical protein